MKYIFVFISIVSTFFASAQSFNKVQVKSKHGLIEGSQEVNGVISFKGVPFAAPPVG